MSVVSLEGVWARYPRAFWQRPGPWVLEDIALEVAEGEVLGVVGPSGGGKSSLARVLCGELAATRGTVLLDGVPFDGAARSGRVQRLYQATDAHLPPHLDILGALEETVAIHGGGARVESVLRGLGLWARRRAPCAELSGGERRRAGIARIVLTRPRLLVLDEPTSGLDAHHGVEAMELLLGPERAQCAVVIITHDLRVVRAVADRLCVMSQGRIVEERSAKSLGHGPHHPRTAALLQPAGPILPERGRGCAHVGWCPLEPIPSCHEAPPRLRALPAGGDGCVRLACHRLAPGENA